MLLQYFNRYYKAALALLLLVLFFAIYLHPTDEIFIDLGGHLLRGRLLAQTHVVSTTNTFSYTNPSFPVINLEWFTELLFYLVYSFSGINGLIFLTILVTLVSSIILYKFAADRINAILVSCLAVCYLMLLAQRADVLPELFSYLFMAIFIVILYKFREKYTNLIWLLVPLQLLWVNMHIYFIIGILLVGLFLVEGLILFRKKDEGKYLKTLAMVFGANWIVSLLNPFGLSGLLFPFTFAPNFGFSVQENNNILQTGYGQIFFFGQGISVQLFDILAVLLILAIILQYKKIRLIDIIISVTGIVGAALAIRDLGVFIFITFIPAAFIFNSLGEKYQRLRNMKLRKAMLIALPLLTVFLSWWTAVQLGGPGLGMAHGYENAIDFFRENHLTGPILNNFNIGTYLEYKLYPQERVFVDTNPVAYPVAFFKNVYTPVFQNLSAFKAAENQYHFNTIILGYTNGIPYEIGFLRYLVNSKEWKLVYLDDSTVIFVKNIPQNEAIIHRYAMTDATFRLPSYQTFTSLYNLAHVLDFIEWKNSEIAVFQKMHELNPKDCTITRNVLGLSGYTPSQINPILESDVNDYNMYCR